MTSNTLDPRLLELLACPCCDKPAPLTQTADGLVCAICKRTFPVHDGIVTLLPEAGKTQEPPPTAAS